MDVVIADDFDNITFELLSQWSAQAQMKMDKVRVSYPCTSSDKQNFVALFKLYSRSKNQLCSKSTVTFTQKLIQTEWVHPYQNKLFPA